MKLWEIIIGVFVIIPRSSSYICDRSSKYTYKPSLRNDRYVIEISGNPKGYIPKETYTITLKTDTTAHFTEFFIVAETENPLNQQNSFVGKFNLIDPMLTSYTYKCPNAIIQTTLLPKSKVQVQWKAPDSDKGCIAIKATVVEASDSWFTDDNGLTKILCAENEKNEDMQALASPMCNTCDEAKYEIAFQGMWSRNTHPKNFPADMWSTKLGDIVGASHKFRKSFWDYNAMATRGLQKLAEEGDTRELETELIEMLKNDEVRTIIKARELSPPTITGISYTVFRVDKSNHLLSLVSKITPSPDWIVGVANLELCENNSWTSGIALNLYPYDVGTDDGITYNSSASKTEPQQPIRRITANSPNREESPFYNQEGTPVKPIAKLYVTRQKIYKKNCEDDEENSETGVFEDKCAVTEWGEWSSCSPSCVRTRDRAYLKPENEGYCKEQDVLLQENEICEDCDTTEDECGEWEPWSSCSATCGRGIKTRNRLPLNDEDEEYNEENKKCSQKEEVECSNGEECEATEESNSESSFIGPVDTDSQTIVLTQSPDGVVKDCRTSEWSSWGPCSATERCTKGYQYKERHIIEHQQNGGKPCPSKLRKSKRCKVPCTHRSASVSVTYEEEIVNCEMGTWSSWSPCNKTCGHALQQRTREIKKRPKNGGRPCGVRIEQRVCGLPLACPSGDSFPYFS